MDIPHSQNLKPMDGTNEIIHIATNKVKKCPAHARMKPQVVCILKHIKAMKIRILFSEFNMFYIIDVSLSRR
jgi:hypothetical protein